MITPFCDIFVTFIRFSRICSSVVIILHFFFEFGSILFVDISVLLFFAFVFLPFLRPMPMKTQSFHKNDEFQKIHVIIFQVHLAMGTFLKTARSELLKNPEKNILGPMSGHDRLQKNLGGCFSPSGDNPSPRQRPIDKNNDCVLNSERSALGSGSDPP